MNSTRHQSSSLTLYNPLRIWLLPISSVALLEVDRQFRLTPFYRWVNESPGNLVPFPRGKFPITLLHIGISGLVSSSPQRELVGTRSWKAFESSSSWRCHQCPSLGIPRSRSVPKCKASDGSHPVQYWAGPGSPSAGAGTPAGVILGGVLHAVPFLLLSLSQDTPKFLLCFHSLLLSLSPGLTFFHPSTGLYLHLQTWPYLSTKLPLDYPLTAETTSRLLPWTPTPHVLKRALSQAVLLIVYYYNTESPIRLLFLTLAKRQELFLIST